MVRGRSAAPSCRKANLGQVSADIRGSWSRSGAVLRKQREPNQTGDKRIPAEQSISREARYLSLSAAASPQSQGTSTNLFLETAKTGCLSVERVDRPRNHLDVRNSPSPDR